MSLGLTLCLNMALLCGILQYGNPCQVVGVREVSDTLQALRVQFIAQFAHVILTLAGCMQSFDTVQQIGTGY